MKRLFFILGLSFALVGCTTNTQQEVVVDLPSRDIPNIEDAIDSGDTLTLDHDDLIGFKANSDLINTTRYGYTMYRIDGAKTGVGWFEYDGEYLILRPKHTLQLNGHEISFSSGNTWGLDDTLYLYQLCDLNTGEFLEQALCTPVTIKHDLSDPKVSGYVDDDKCYCLQWQPVRNATEYLVYTISNNTFTFEYQTTETHCRTFDFNTQLAWDGVETGDVDEHLSTSGFNVIASKFYRNDLKVAVVARSTDGATSGLSYVPPISEEMASKLPTVTVGSKDRVSLPHSFPYVAVDGHTIITLPALPDEAVLYGNTYSIPMKNPLLADNGVHLIEQ